MAPDSVRSGLRAIFVGDDRRPRATWRVLVPFVLVLGGGIAVTAALTGLASTAGGGGLALGVAGDVALALLALGALAVSARYVDRRPLSEYGLRLSRSWGVEFGAGAATGVALVAVAFAASYALGWVRVVDVLSAGDAGSIAGGAAVLGVGWAFGAFWEEALFRGTIVTNATEGLAARGLAPATAMAGAVVVSAVSFGVVHGPLSQAPGGTSLAGMLAVWTLMGGLLGTAYAVSGELSFPIGLHFAVNVAANHLFFGLDAAAPAVLRVEVTAGGLAHPVGGLPMIGALLAGHVVVLGWAVRRDRGPALAGAVARRAGDGPGAAR